MHKTVTEETEAIELLKAGWTIDKPFIGYARLIGSHSSQEPCGIHTGLFWGLQNKGRIKVIRSMRQGHPLFHGRVDIYGLVEEPNLKSEKETLSDET